MATAPGPEGTSAPSQCQFYLSGKRRFCRFPPCPGKQYCGHHLYQQTQQGEKQARGGGTCCAGSRAAWAASQTPGIPGCTRVRLPRIRYPMHIGGAYIGGILVILHPVMSSGPLPHRPLAHCGRIQAQGSPEEVQQVHRAAEGEGEAAEGEGEAAPDPREKVRQHLTQGRR